MTHEEKQLIEIHPAVKNEEKDRLTREALVDVEGGAVVDHSEIIMWIKHL